MSIANAGSAIGRLSGGILADRYGTSGIPVAVAAAYHLARPGALNVMIPATFVAGVFTYIWPFVTNKGGFAAIGLLYGYVPLVAVTLCLIKSIL